MKRLFDCADRYIQSRDWKMLAFLKFCLCAIGVLLGLSVPEKTRLEARFPYHGSGAMTRSPSPLAWRPDFPGAPREAH